MEISMIAVASSRVGRMVELGGEGFDLG